MEAGIYRCKAVDAGRCSLIISLHQLQPLLLQSVLSVAAVGCFVADLRCWGQPFNSTARDVRIQVELPAACDWCLL